MNHISFNGSKAGGKTTLAYRLSDAGFGEIFEFYRGRWKFQTQYLSKLHPKLKIPLNTWKSYTALLSFALDWHQHKTDERLIFDHFYADYLIQNLSSISEIETLLAYVNAYGLPPFEEGYNFFIDADYDVYLERRAKREKEQPHRRGHKVIPEINYLKRRDLYLDLVEMGYLIHIDANGNEDEVYTAVVNILEGLNV